MGNQSVTTTAIADSHGVASRVEKPQITTRTALVNHTIDITNISLAGKTCFLDSDGRVLAEVYLQNNRLVVVGKTDDYLNIKGEITANNFVAHGNCKLTFLDKVSCAQSAKIAAKELVFTQEVSCEKLLTHTSGNVLFAKEVKVSELDVKAINCRCSDKVTANNVSAYISGTLSNFKELQVNGSASLEVDTVVAEGAITIKGKHTARSKIKIARALKISKGAHVDIANADLQSKKISNNGGLQMSDSVLTVENNIEASGDVTLKNTPCSAKSWVQDAGKIILDGDKQTELTIKDNFFVKKQAQATLNDSNVVGPTLIHFDGDIECNNSAISCTKLASFGDKAVTYNNTTVNAAAEIRLAQSTNLENSTLKSRDVHIDRGAMGFTDSVIDAEYCHLSPDDIATKNLKIINNKRITLYNAGEKVLQLKEIDVGTENLLLMGDWHLKDSKVIAHSTKQEGNSQNFEGNVTLEDSIMHTNGQIYTADKFEFKVVATKNLEEDALKAETFLSKGKTELRNVRGGFKKLVLAEESIRLKNSQVEATEQVVVADAKAAIDTDSQLATKDFAAIGKSVIDVGDMPQAEQQVNPTSKSTPEQVGQKSNSSKKWYTDDQINYLLTHYLSERKDTECLVAVLGTNTDGGINILQASLLQHEQQRQQLGVTKQPIKDKVIVPVNLSGTHWVLVFVDFAKSNAAPKVSYFDPLGGSPHQDVVAALKAAYSDSVIKNISKKLQNNSDDCGPWIVESAKRLASRGSLPSVKFDIKRARRDHKAVLSRHLRISGYAGYDADNLKAKDNLFCAAESKLNIHGGKASGGIVRIAGEANLKHGVLAAAELKVSGAVSAKEKSLLAIDKDAVIGSGGEIDIEDSKLKAKELRNNNKLLLTEGAKVSATEKVTTGSKSVTGIEDNSRVKTDEFKHHGKIEGKNNQQENITAKKLVTSQTSEIKGDSLNMDINSWRHHGYADVDALRAIGKRLYNIGGTINGDDSLFLGFDHGTLNFGQLSGKNVTVHSNLVNLLGVVNATNYSASGFVNLNLAGLVSGFNIQQNSLLSFNAGLMLPNLPGELSDVLRWQTLLTFGRIAALNLLPQYSSLINLGSTGVSIVGNQSCNLYNKYSDSIKGGWNCFHDHSYAEMLLQSPELFTGGVNYLTDTFKTYSDLETWRDMGVNKYHDATSMHLYEIMPKICEVKSSVQYAINLKDTVQQAHEDMKERRKENKKQREEKNKLQEKQASQDDASKQQEGKSAQSEKQDDQQVDASKKQEEKKKQRKEMAKKITVKCVTACGPSINDESVLHGNVGAKVSQNVTTANLAYYNRGVDYGVASNNINTVYLRNDKYVGGAQVNVTARTVDNNKKIHGSSELHMNVGRLNNNIGGTLKSARGSVKADIMNQEGTMDFSEQTYIDVQDLELGEESKNHVRNGKIVGGNVTNNSKEFVSDDISMELKGDYNVGAGSHTTSNDFYVQAANINDKGSWDFSGNCFLTATYDLNFEAGSSFTGEVSEVTPTVELAQESAVDANVEIEPEPQNTDVAANSDEQTPNEPQDDKASAAKNLPVPKHNLQMKGNNVDFRGKKVGGDYTQIEGKHVVVHDGAELQQAIVKGDSIDIGEMRVEKARFEAKDNIHLHKNEEVHSKDVHYKAGKEINDEANVTAAGVNVFEAEHYNHSGDIQKDDAKSEKPCAIVVDAKTAELNGSAAVDRVSYQVNEFSGANDLITGKGVYARYQFSNALEVVTDGKININDKIDRDCDLSATGSSVLLNHAYNNSGRGLELKSTEGDVIINADIDAKYFVGDSAGELWGNHHIYTEDNIGLFAKGRIVDFGCDIEGENVFTRGSEYLKLTKNSAKARDDFSDVHFDGVPHYTIGNGAEVHARNFNIIESTSGNTENHGGVLRGDVFTRVDSAANVLNICNEIDRQGRYDIIKEYQPGQILGGTGNDATDGAGLMISAADRIIFDGSDAKAMGDVYVDAKNGIEFLARTHQYVSNIEKHRTWCGAKEKIVDVDTQVHGCNIVGGGGKSYVTAKDGSIKAYSANFLAKNGTDIEAKNNIDLFSTIAQKKHKKVNDWLGIYHNSHRENHDFATPTVIFDIGKSNITTKVGDITLRGAVCGGGGDLTIDAGGKVTLAKDILNHYSRSRSRSFSLSCCGYDTYNYYGDGQFTWNDLLRNEPLIGKFMDAEKAVASGASSADIAKKLFDFGKEALKTDKGLQKDAKENGWAKAVGSHYCPNDLKDLNPAIDINYRDSKTVGTSQTTGPASIDRGDVTIKANDGVVLKNGMQVKAQGDLDIDTPELLLKAAELLSQCKSHNSKLGIGVTAQGQFVDASVAFDCTQQKGVTYENSGLTSARTVNLHHGDKAMDKAVLDGANIEGDRVAGGIESLLVTTKQDVNKSTSYQTSANTKGDVSVGYAHSSSRKANEISGIVGHQGIGEDLQIGTLENTGGSFTSENEVDLHPKQIINKELKEKDKHISAGLSGNVNDFIPKEKTESSNNTDMAGKEAEPKPPKVHVKVDYKDKRGRRQATVFGSEGTKITSDSVIGEMNQDSADGYKKDRDWHIKGQGTVLVPCKESLEYAKYKYDETKEKIEKTVQTIKETKEKIFPAKPKGGVSDAFQPAAELIKRGSINEHPGQTPSVTSVSQSFFHDPLAAPSPASILLDDKVPDISLVSPSEQSDQYPLAVNPDCAGISLESDNASTYVRGTAAGVGIATGPQYTLGISSDALNTAYAFDKQLKPGVGNIHNLSNADKGMLGEMAGARDLISGGYEMFPSKLPSNQGFDGVFIKKGSGGEIAEIVILESKATKNIAGRAKLGSTTTKGVQCSPEWYSATLNEMAHSPSKSVRDTAELLMKNESKVTLGCNTLSPKGNSWGIANLSNKPAEFLGKSADATIAAEAKSVGAIKAGKYAKRAGKVCVVAGAGLDAYEVYGQFAEDRKTGDYSKTYKTVSTKAWSWTGAIACAELGASIGAGGGPIGAAVCGTLGGIAGAIGGEKAAEVAYDWAGSAKDWVSDIFKGNVEDDIQEASVTALTP